MKQIAVVMSLAGLMAAGSTRVVRADVQDSWITTKATIMLLTTDGLSVKGASVDTIDGKVTIHGKVATSADRTKAEETVLDVDGVKTVENLLQVVPANKKDMVAINDPEVKERVEASLKTDRRMNEVKVASVNDGVVLLSGKAENLDDNLRAIRNAYGVPGVHRVSSDIQIASEN